MPVDTSAPLGEQALEYADEYGYEVFPLQPRGPHAKQPYTGHGLYDATSDLSQIRAWWEEHPDALIGERVPADEVLLDVDPRHGGMGTFRALKEEFGLTPSRVHYSGRGDGGGHLHFRRPPGRLSGVKLAAWAKERGLGHPVVVDGKEVKWVSGIDILHHDWRYTILPGSPHPDTGEPYHWKGRGPEDPPGSLPEGVVELLRTPEPVKTEPGPYDPNSIADWFSATQGFSWLADKGWELVRGDGTSDGSRWRHPAATSAVSATVRNRCLFVYSENTPFEVTMPGDPAGYTPFKAWSVLCHGGDMKAAARAARALKGPDEPVFKGPVGLGLIVPRHVNWLWDPLLPLGKLVIHAGEPGTMKSSFDVALAAEITNGRGFAERFGPQKVVFLNFEDDDEDGLVPRLMAAGADLSLCFSVDDEEGNPEGLRRVVDEVRPIAVFVDPFGSWAEAMENTGVETQIRKSLKPLRQLGKTSGAVIKVNCHPNKQNSLSDALYRIAGSLGGMVGYARVVLASKRDDNGYVAGVIKSNVGPDQCGVEYFPKFTPLVIDGQAAEYPRVMFGDVVPIDRKTFFASEEEEKGPNKAQQCAEAIKEILKDGPRLTREVKAELSGRFGRNAIQDGATLAGVELLGSGKGARWRLSTPPSVAVRGAALSPQRVTSDLTQSVHSAAPPEVSHGPPEIEEGTV